MAALILMKKIQGSSKASWRRIRDIESCGNVLHIERILKKVLTPTLRNSL